jgi:hypothetical protein
MPYDSRLCGNPSFYNSCRGKACPTLDRTGDGKLCPYTLAGD